MKPKYKKLLLSILLDGFGMLSFVIPGLGELFDVIWAPLSAYLILKMYKGAFSKVASIISFGEEAGFIGTDIIPTFTLSWVYEQLFMKETTVVVKDVERPS